MPLVAVVVSTVSVLKQYFLFFTREKQLVALENILPAHANGTISVKVHSRFPELSHGTVCPEQSCVCIGEPPSCVLTLTGFSTNVSTSC